MLCSHHSSNNSRLERSYKSSLQCTSKVESYRAGARHLKGRPGLHREKWYWQMSGRDVGTMAEEAQNEPELGVTCSGTKVRDGWSDGCSRGDWYVGQFTGKSTHKHGPQRAPPTSGPTPPARLFVSVVGPHLKWSYHGHDWAGRRHKRGHGRCPSGPVSVCAFSCGCLLA